MSLCILIFLRGVNKMDKMTVMDWAKKNKIEHPIMTMRIFSTNDKARKFSDKFMSINKEK